MTSSSVGLGEQKSTSYYSVTPGLTNVRKRTRGYTWTEKALWATGVTNVLSAYKTFFPQSAGRLSSVPLSPLSTRISQASGELWKGYGKVGLTIGAVCSAARKATILEAPEKGSFREGMEGLAELPYTYFVSPILDTTKKALYKTYSATDYVVRNYVFDFVKDIIMDPVTPAEVLVGGYLLISGARDIKNGASKLFIHQAGLTTFSNEKAWLLTKGIAKVGAAVGIYYLHSYLYAKQPAQSKTKTTSNTSGGTINNLPDGTTNKFTPTPTPSGKPCTTFNLAKPEDQAKFRQVYSIPSETAIDESGFVQVCK